LSSGALRAEVCGTYENGAAARNTTKVPTPRDGSTAVGVNPIWNGKLCNFQKHLVYTCDDEMTKEVAMAVADSRTFRSGNSEAVRLPRNVAFGREVEVTIVRSGDVLTIYPARRPIGELVKQLTELPRPSEIEVRDDEVLPERSGL
jgi:antitoxin VapB